MLPRQYYCSDSDKRRARNGRQRTAVARSWPVLAAADFEVTVLTSVSMDARIDRDAHLKALKSQTRLPTQTWYEWFWGIKKSVPARATDAATSEALRNAFTQMLDQVEPPDVFKPSEVAQQLSKKELEALGYEKWEEALPGVYELGWELREFGDLDILRKGKVLGDDVELKDIDGPVRFRRKVW